MLIKKKYTKFIFGASILLVIFIYPILSNTFSVLFPGSEMTGPIYNVAMAETTQQNVWKLCEENDLSYELLLSIYHGDGIENKGIQAVEKDIVALTYLRDYWTNEGYLDEDVFDFMILSWDMSIEGCKDYIKENPDYDENEYLLEVSGYKYELEQNLNTI